MRQSLNFFSNLILCSILSIVYYSLINIWSLDMNNSCNLDSYVKIYDITYLYFLQFQRLIGPDRYWIMSGCD